MKRFTLNTILLFVLAAPVFLGSCNKEVMQPTTYYPALSPKNEDMNADTWKPVLITNTGAFNVPPPDAVNSSAYKADLDEIKMVQSAGVSADQQAIIDYWSAGAVLRWNEILRDLVAKHNVPPYQNADGSYPFPSSTNPFAYPIFPFSNPPYSARAYAYVSAAQYDALVAAYHYKKLYNHSAPYFLPGIKGLIPKSTLPSYPSEEAVVAGASVEIMKLLFPADVAFLQQKAAEEMQYRILVGGNVRGELNAGQSLGAQVADVFAARAKGDRAGKAIGSAPEWAALQSNATSRGDQFWVSLESPARPPMLPLFSKVLPFLFDTLTVVALRPGPPNLAGSAAFKQEEAEVLSFSQNPTRDHQAQVQFWADGAGTYTPPGHWNYIAANEFVKEGYSEVRWARNFALLNMAEMDVAICCWDTKYFYFNERPSQANPKIKTLTGIPNFPSYSSGHSNFSGAAATVLTYLLPSRGSEFTDLANQAALSRLYGAIHYRSDVEVGLVTGTKVGGYAIRKAQSDGAATEKMP